VLAAGVLVTFRSLMFLAHDNAHESRSQSPVPILVVVVLLSVTCAGAVSLATFQIVSKTVFRLTERRP
jgi:hypothetical protein